MNELEPLQQDNISKVETLAKELLLQHNLTDWKFLWDEKPISRLGQCRYTSKEIAISKKPATLLPFEELLDTLIHELAHALTPGAGHGKVWKEKCIELGCKPSAFANLNLDSIYKLKGCCPTCNAVMYANRKPKSGIVCVKCCNIDYAKTGNSNYHNHIYEWAKNI